MMGMIKRAVKLSAMYLAGVVAEQTYEGLRRRMRKNRRWH